MGVCTDGGACGLIRCTEWFVEVICDAGLLNDGARILQVKGAASLVGRALSLLIASPNPFDLNQSLLSIV